MAYEKGEKASSVVESDFHNEALHEEPKEETLHRGLKARQISMIAVYLDPAFTHDLLIG